MVENKRKQRYILSRRWDIKHCQIHPSQSLLQGQRVSWLSCQTDPKQSVAPAGGNDGFRGLWGFFGIDRPNGNGLDTLLLGYSQLGHGGFIAEHFGSKLTPGDHLLLSWREQCCPYRQPVWEYAGSVGLHPLTLFWISLVIFAWDLDRECLEQQEAVWKWISTDRKKV